MNDTMKALLVITGRGMGGGDAVNALNIARSLEKKRYSM